MTGNIENWWWNLAVTLNEHSEGHFPLVDDMVKVNMVKDYICTMKYSGEVYLNYGMFVKFLADLDLISAEYYHIPSE